MRVPRMGYVCGRRMSARITGSSGALALRALFLQSPARSMNEPAGSKARSERITAKTGRILCIPVFSLPGYLICPSPPMSLVISSMRSNGKGGAQRGFMAMLISFMGLSSAAMRFELNAPQRRQR